MRALCSLVLLCGLWGSPVPGWADAFTDARRAINMQTSVRDSSAVGVRAGIGLATGAQSASTTLFRSQATVGGGCAGFDFRESMVDAFRSMPQLFESLLEAVIHEMPMLGLCYLSPTLCQLGQHFQSLLNIAIQAKYGQCQNIQLAAMYAGKRLRGGEEGRCLEDQASAGASLPEAMRKCTGDMTSTRSPLGVPRENVNLIQEALEAAGASPETQTLARNVFGEVRLSTGGKLTVQAEQDPNGVLGLYEGHKSEARAALQAVVDEYAATGTVQPETLRQASIPGRPLPMAAAEALAAFKDDPVRGETFLDNLSTSEAVVQLTWQCHELENQIAAAIADNPHMSDAERAPIQQRFEAVRRQLLQLTQKLTASQMVQGDLDTLLREYTKVQSVATQAGMAAPLRRLPPMPFGKQQPSGVSR